MTHTARISTIARRWHDIFTSEVLGQEGFFAELPLLTVQDVFYGDQDKIARTPTIVVEPGAIRHDWPPRPNLMSENMIEMHFLIYHVRMDQSTQQTKMDSDLLGDLVAEYININHTRLRDATGSDLVIHGNVIERDPGYIARGQTRWHATHLTWRAITKTRITEAG